MVPVTTYEVFIICPQCEYREHIFSDVKIFARACPQCGRKFGAGDLPVQSLTYESDEDIKHVAWLRLNYQHNDRLRMPRDGGITVITHYSSER
jgi:hypothetical protein